MNSSATLEHDAAAISVEITENELVVRLLDGRVLSVPLSWYPRLTHGSMAERRNYVLTGRGYGIHWPDLDEDISIQGLLRGNASGESQTSLQAWLDQRLG